MASSRLTRRRCQQRSFRRHQLRLEGLEKRYALDGDSLSVSMNADYVAAGTNFPTDYGSASLANIGEPISFFLPQQNLVSFASVTDATPGMVITSLDLNGGQLWYSVNSGNTWFEITLASQNSSTVLIDDGNTRLHYEPPANYSSQLTDVFTFEAYDFASSMVSGTSRVVASTGSSSQPVGSYIIDHTMYEGTLGDGGKIKLFSDGIRAAAIHDDGLEILDISNPSSIQRIGITPSESPTIEGLFSDIHIAGSEASVFINPTTPSTNGAFVVDLTNQSVPQLLSYNANTFAWTVTSNSDGSMVILGSTGGPEGQSFSNLHFFDTTNRASPQLLSSLNLTIPAATFGTPPFEFTAESDLEVHGITISPDGHTLYVSCLSEMQHQFNVPLFFVVDISNVQQPQVIAQVSKTGFTSDLIFSPSHALSLDGNTLYVAANEGTYNETGGGGFLAAYDVSDPTSPSQMWKRQFQYGGGFANEVVLDQSTGRIYVAYDGGVRSFAVNQFGVTNEALVSAAGMTNGVAVSADGKHAFVMEQELLAVYAQNDNFSVSVDITSAPNGPPTDLSLSFSAVGENSPGATVGQLTTTGANVDGTFTYTLVPGSGDTENSLFYIEGDVLKVGANLDYESSSTAYVRIRTTDSHGEHFEKAFSIGVQNDNEPPTDILLSSSSIEENKPVGSAVGTLTSADPDGSNFNGFAESFTYSLANGTGDADNGSFEIIGDELRAKEPLNYEVKDSHSVRIQTADNMGVTFEKQFLINISNVNDALVGEVTIDGEPTQNVVLSANTSTIQDEDGLGEFSYQWLRDGTPISGANSSTHTLTQDDVGTQISVRIDYIDNAGTAESLTSAQTSVVIKSPLESPDYQITSFLNTRDEFESHFSRQDTRVEIFYDESTTSLRLTGPHELGIFDANERWTEFAFEIKATQLSFGNLDLLMGQGWSTGYYDANRHGIKLTDHFQTSDQWQSVQISYDEATRTLTAYVGGIQVTQASVFEANWNRHFSCMFRSGSGQEARVEIRNARIGRPVTDTTKPQSFFQSAPSIRTTPLANSRLIFSEPVTGLQPSHISLSRDGESINISGLSITGGPANYLLSGLEHVTGSVGTYELRFQNIDNQVSDSAGNLADDSIALTWEVSPSSVSEQTHVLANYQSFWTYYRQSDDRGEFFYDPENNTLVEDGPYELANFSVPQRWNDFSFVVDVEELSFSNFFLRLTDGNNPYTINLSDSIHAGSTYQVRITYDENTKVLRGYVNDELARETTVLDANWNTRFNMMINQYSGGQNNILTFSDMIVAYNLPNDAPTLDALSAIDINEDDPEQFVNLAGISAGVGETQELRVTAISSNTDLIPNPTIDYTSPNSTGSLIFTPVPSENGTASITVTLEDAGLDNNFNTTEDNRQATYQFEVNVFEVISESDSATLAKDGLGNLYVNIQPVTYKEQQAQTNIAGFAAIGATSDDGANALLVERASVRYRLVTDESWRINGLFHSLHNESSLPLNPAAREISSPLNISAVSGAYEINGVNNPTLTVRRGQTYTFNLNTGVHRLWLQTTGSGYQSANVYDSEFTGNSQTTGEHQWVVPEDAPDEIFYQCEFHPVMFGKIIVVD